MYYETILEVAKILLRSSAFRRRYDHHRYEHNFHTSDIHAFIGTCKTRQ